MKVYLGAYSIVEPIVASVIFMLSFLLAVDAISSVDMLGMKSIRLQEVEEAMETCAEDYVRESSCTGTEKVYMFDWGTITVSAEVYLDGLLEVTVMSETKNGTDMVYRYLMEDIYE
ncbi:MAG: hypothetical protein NC115_01810 [Bacteroidales bacterium]|nr:hypothetical protein [Bacteroides sp.]MCM1198662.1 hypothetical protein [Clostridium sp.]MCM1501386.1 hypothetical protein [Bacteroidales bacterium]